MVLSSRGFIQNTMTWPPRSTRFSMTCRARAVFPEPVDPEIKTCSPWFHSLPSLASCSRVLGPGLIFRFQSCSPRGLLILDFHHSNGDNSNSHSTVGHDQAKTSRLTSRLKNGLTQFAVGQ